MPKLNEMHIQKRLTTGFIITTAITSIGWNHSFALYLQPIHLRFTELRFLPGRHRKSHDHVC